MNDVPDVAECIEAFLELGDLVTAWASGSRLLIFTGRLTVTHVPEQMYRFIAPDGKLIFLHAWSIVHVVARAGDALG